MKKERLCATHGYIDGDDIILTPKGSKFCAKCFVGDKDFKLSKSNKLRNRITERNRQRFHRDNLSDTYIKDVLSNRLNGRKSIPRHKITPELIEIKRAQLMLHRGIKEHEDNASGRLISSRLQEYHRWFCTCIWGCHSMRPDTKKKA